MIIREMNLEPSGEGYRSISWADEWRGDLPGRVRHGSTQGPEPAELTHWGHIRSVVTASLLPTPVPCLKFI